MPDPRPPHLLYVAWGFPPCRSGGVYRALATANTFAAHDWDVTVLTVDRRVFTELTGADEALEAAVDPKVRVVRTPFAWPTLETDVRTYSPFRAYLPRLWRRLRLLADRVPFPEVAYGPWRRPLERAALAVHDERPVDLVLATANPNVAWSAGLALHRRRGVPYVLDHRDAWSLDVFSGARVHGPRSRAGRWERRLVASAREVWFVNAPIRDWYAAAYPDAAARMHVVANGWDADLLVALPDGPPAPDPARPLVFGYIGTVSTKVPLGELFSGWRVARDRDPLVAAATGEIYGYLGFYGTANPELAELVAAARQDGMAFLGPLSKTRVSATYASLDVLLLVLGKGRYVTSGKVFEYLATGLPVVSVHDPGNAASDVLRGYPLWFPARSLAAGDVADALSAAAQAAATADPAVRAQAREFAARYRRDLQLMPRVDALAAAVRATSIEGTPR